MTNHIVDTLLKRLDRAYKHQSAEAFGNLLMQTQAKSTEIEHRQVEAWFQSSAMQTDAFARSLQRFPLARLLARLLYWRSTLHNELLRGRLLQPVATETVIEYVADEEGRVMARVEGQEGMEWVRQRRRSIESMHWGFIRMVGEDRISDLVDGRFTVRIPLDRRKAHGPDTTR